MRAVIVSMVLSACSGGDRSSPGVDAAADARSCVTSTACTTDNDCTVEPGTRCNTELPIPRCQPLDCGHAGLPCAGPEFCSSGLVCFDEEQFGAPSTTFKAGVCSGWAETRDACNARCMDAWTRSEGMVLYECTQQQATALCLDVCGRYPMWDTCQNHFETYSANDWRFGYMSCEDANLCPGIALSCDGKSVVLKHEIDGCY